jgi:hypothetical protein
MDFNDDVLSFAFFGFLYLLGTSKYDNNPNLRGLLLEKSDFVNYFYTFFWNYNKSFCWFLSSFCDMYNYYYKDIIQCLKMFVEFDYNNNIIVREKTGKIDYEKYLLRINNNEKLDFSDNYFKCVKAELIAYRSELNFLRRYCEYVNVSPDFYVKWVAKDFGDGYGYDVLSYDFFNQKEKLIEVKGTSGSGFYGSLSINELNKLEEFVKYGYDYYVYRYNFYTSKKHADKHEENVSSYISQDNGVEYEMNILKYISEIDRFFDIKNHNVFRIDRNHEIYQEEDKFAIVTEEKYKNFTK